MKAKIKVYMVTLLCMFLLCVNVSYAIEIESGNVKDENDGILESINVEARYEAAKTELTSRVSVKSIERLKAICIDSANENVDKDLGMTLFKSSIISLNNQIQAYGFTDEQINAYIDGLVSSTPDTLANSNILRSYPTSADHTRPFHDDGAGYEVQSKPGYMESTAFGIVGSGFTKKAQGQAGYMFYTVSRDTSSGYKGNDFGLAYINGKWVAFASGQVTGWQTFTLNSNIYAGQKIYLHAAIVGDYVRIRILDGDNFNNVFFDRSYYHSGYFPTSGSGVIINRQITLCDDSDTLGTGIYLKNASFYDSYLYTPSSNSRYNSSNTTSTRRGRFKADWTNYSNVTVDSSSTQEWYAEKVSITF
ncbi:MAG: hypothetical protein LBL49_01005 [Clostridiales Family XIII bacterium]|jgi:hypothetical protein|nr:hypothetical protein [Clostridiales Family XIII bacterium]